MCASRPKQLKVPPVEDVETAVSQYGPLTVCTQSPDSGSDGIDTSDLVYGHDTRDSFAASNQRAVLPMPGGTFGRHGIEF